MIFSVEFIDCERPISNLHEIGEFIYLFFFVNSLKN